MSSAHAPLPEIHGRAMQALQERIRVLVGREDRARKALEAVLAERERLDAERAALQMAEQIYLRTLGVTADDQEVITSSNDTKIRARIGPQRYLMLAELRAAKTPLKLNEVADRTGLGIKRVKDQLVTDEALGVVETEWDNYSLTAVGLDLMSRFEAYKRSRGEELPHVGQNFSGVDDEED